LLTRGPEEPASGKIIKLVRFARNSSCSQLRKSAVALSNRRTQSKNDFCGRFFDIETAGQRLGLSPRTIGQRFELIGAPVVASGGYAWNQPNEQVDQGTPRITLGRTNDSVEPRMRKNECHFGLMTFSKRTDHCRPDPISHHRVRHPARWSAG
jgi:hypothetical protein